MKVAKVIRHRHRWEYSINDVVKSIEERDDFKIVFSDPGELRMFETWCKQNDGEWAYNKTENKMEGKLPTMKIFEQQENLCWCDIFQYYLLHIAGYGFHSVLNPYKGEVYVKNA